MSYKVRTEMFEGPFDLLVYLIENAKMNIYDLQISQITDQYLAYLKEMESLNVAVGSEFVVLAATLIEIKSRMMLPRPQGPAEDMPEEDPRSELVQRLLEYKLYKEKAQMLEESMDFNSCIYEKPQEDISEFINAPDEYLSLDIDQFVEAFKAFLNRKKKIEDINRRYTLLERERESTENRMRFIHSLFRDHDGRTVSFKESIKNPEDKFDVVLSFTSVLELVNHRSILASQDQQFGDILLTERQEQSGQAKTDNVDSAD